MTLVSFGRVLPVLAAAAIAAACSACSGGEAANGAPLLAGPLQAAGKVNGSKRVLFVSNLDGGIRIYTADIHAKNPPMLGQITQGATRPEGEWVDRKGILYVVNAAEYPEPADVAEYKRGATSPFRTITDGVLAPYSVAVGNDGTVYVNAIETGNTGVVVVYPPGGTEPKETITLPENKEYGMSGGGMAVDPQGNVYAANFGDAVVSQFFKIAPGSSQATNLGLTGYGGDAIAMDGSGNLYTSGYSGASGFLVAVYPSGATSPSRTFSLTFEPYGLTATSKGTLYVAGDGEVAEFAPGASEPTNTINTVYGETFTYGVAIGSQ